MSLSNTTGSLRSLTALALALGWLFLQALPQTALATARAVPELIDIEPELAVTPAGEQLEAVQASFRDALGDRDYEMALEHAKQMVELASSIWGAGDPRVSQALTNLGIAQAEASDFRAAQQNFAAAIRVHEEADGHLVGDALINPLNGLANASIALNELEQAVPLFERAVHVSHVTAGPNNLEQIDILDSLSRTHYFLGNLRRANKIQDIMYRLQQRRFSADSDQFIDALARRARWYTQVGDFTEATYAFRRLERTIVKYHGKDDPRLIEPLVELAFVAPRQATSTPGLTPEIAQKEARRSVNRAVRIARLQNETDPYILPRTLTRQGDFLLYMTAHRSAQDAYQEAYALTSANPVLEDLHEELFGQPVPVVRRPIRSVYHRDTGGSAVGTFPDRGYVELSFDINQNGRPIGIRVVNSEPAGLMDGDVVRRVRRFVYRPSLAGGRPTPYTGLTFRHDFRYDERRLTQSENEYIEKARAARESANAAREAAGTPVEVPVETPVEPRNTGEDEAIPDAAVEEAPEDSISGGDPEEE